jgi:YD repeat-containing protein
MGCASGASGIEMERCLQMAMFKMLCGASNCTSKNLVLLCLLPIVFGGRLLAQQSCTKSIPAYCWGDNYPIAPGAKCQADGVPRVCQPCGVNTCPAHAADETNEKCPNGGAPICLNTGNTFIEQTDLRVPGLSGGLTLMRSWNSKWPSSQTGVIGGMFGSNWSSTFEERVFVGGDGTVKYWRSDGRFWSFVFTNYITQSGTIVGSALQVVAPADESATLATGSTYWTISFKSGEQRLFNATAGNLVSIIDRNGNTTQLTYDSQNRLITVTDPGGRHLYFAHGNSSFPFLTTAVTSDIGLSLSYSYDVQGRLVTATKPDQTILSFQYDNSSLIAAVLDSSGKILESHTYDALRRGLSSSRANGVDAVSVSYPKPDGPHFGQ